MENETNNRWAKRYKNVSNIPKLIHDINFGYQVVNKSPRKTTNTEVINALLKEVNDLRERIRQLEIDVYS